jgi:DNA-binding transcriptional LysR family regulator
MDLDLAQVRGFVAVAERLHFGRAAATLFVSQQALSKRIQRLEQTIGEPLFTRGKHGVELNAVGARFLPYARELIAAADAAVVAAGSDSRPLRVDVWGHLQVPLRLVSRLIRECPDLLVDVSMRRSLGAAADALQRGEIDAAFGRVHDLADPWPTRLTSRLVYLERDAIGLPAAHRLGNAAVIQTSDLRGERLWMPGTATPPEVMGLCRRFAECFGMELDTEGHNLGPDHVLDVLGSDPTACTLVGSDWHVPADAAVRKVQPDPQPCFPWSLVWRDCDRHPDLPRLLGFVEKTGRDEDWLACRPDRDWMPEIDLPDLVHG